MREEFKIEAPSSEGLLTPAGMRKRLIEAWRRGSSPIINDVISFAWQEGLSGEDTYTVLAYAALVAIEQGQVEAMERWFHSNPSVRIDPNKWDKPINEEKGKEPK